MLKVQDLLVSVIASIDVIQKDVDDFLEKLARLCGGVLILREDICKEKFSC
jgi:hypothetical protein